MKPLRLKITNYRPFADVDVDLSGLDVVAITGPNGSGKSALCEAMLWALYGGSRSAGVDSVVRLGADHCSCELEYSHNASVYRVIRTRTLNRRSDLVFSVQQDGGWQPLSGATIAETQARITTDLAMDENLFRASACAMQGESAGICEAGPAQRKEVLMAILQDRLSQFGPLHERAKTGLKQAEDALLVARNRRGVMEAELADRDRISEGVSRLEAELADLREELAKLQGEHDTLREQAAAAEALQGRIADLSAQIAELERDQESRSLLIAEQERIADECEAMLENAEEIRQQARQAADARVRLDAMNKLREQHQALGSELATLQAEYNGQMETLEARQAYVEDQIRADQERLQELEARHALMESVPCYQSDMATRCELLSEAVAAGSQASTVQAQIQNLRSKSAAYARQMIDEQKRFTDESSRLLAAMAELKYSQEAHRELEGLYAKLQGAVELVPELATAEAKRDAALSTIAGAQRQAELDAERKDNLVSRRESLEQEVADADGERLEELLHEIAAAQEQIESYTRAIAVERARLERLDQTRDALTALEEEIASTEARERRCRALRDAFSRDGIPALIIDAAIPEIEQAANDVLATLSDGAMRVQLLTQRRTKTAGIAETLDIIVSDAAGERPYEDWSGGERLRVDLAVRIALGQALAARTGARVETLILDEVCAPLDEAGESALVDCIARLQPTLGLIFLITHRESLRDRLRQHITLTRRNGETRVEVVA